MQFARKIRENANKFTKKQRKYVNEHEKIERKTSIRKIKIFFDLKKSRRNREKKHKNTKI